MAYEVWAPADFVPDEERLPLLVFLHGGGDNENAFDKAKVGQHLDEQLAAGLIPRVIVVVPNGEFGFWENWYDGSKNYRDWVIDEVIPAVQAEYKTLPCPQHCHVGGVSMGGHGTLRFAWFHPDIFNSASVLSAPIFDAKAIKDFSRRWYVKLFIPVDNIWGPSKDTQRIDSEDVYQQWTRQEDLKGMRLFVGVAKKDRKEIIELNRKFHNHLETHDIEHVYLEFEGQHKWKSWTPIIDKVIRFALWGDIEKQLPGQPASSPKSAPPTPSLP